MKRIASFALSFVLVCTLAMAAAPKAAAVGEGPVMTGIQVANATVQKPGVLKINVTINTPSHRVKDIIIMVSERGDFSNYDNLFLSGLSLTGGTHTIDFPLKSTMRSGEWFVSLITFEDHAGNRAVYNANETEHGLDDYWDNSTLLTTGIPAATFTVRDEFNVAYDMSLSHPEMLGRVQSLQAGQAMKLFIDAPSGNVLPKGVFDAIRGKDITVIAYKDGFQWIFNGRNVTQASKDINLELKVSQIKGAEFGVANNIVQVAFAPNGTLPGKAMVRLKSDYLYNLHNINGKLHLYYSNNGTLTEENGNFDLVMDGTDKWCYFDVTHNSKFLVSGQALATKLKRLSFENGAVSLAMGKKRKAQQPVAYPAALATGAIKWKSSNTKVATVNAKTGQVTAKKRAGTAKITASLNGLKATYMVNVYDPAAVYKVTVKAPSKKMGTISGAKTGAYMGGKTLKLTAKAKKGYTFEGWYDGKVKISSKSKLTYKVAKKVTVTAKFKKA